MTEDILLTWTYEGTNRAVSTLTMANEKPQAIAKPVTQYDDQLSEFDVTKGLKKLYDSVLDEPLPASFQDLLEKLDKGGR